VKLRFKI